MKDALTDQRKPQRRGPTKAAEPAKFGRGDRLKLRTRNRILKAGRALFLDGGYVDCTVSDIADRAGVSRASFYVHFANKQDLLSGIVKRDIEGQQVSERHLQLTGKDPQHAIRSWIRRYVRQLERNRDGLRLYNYAAAIDPGVAVEAYAASGRSAVALARNNPQFRIFDAEGQVDENRLIGLRFILFAIDQLGASVAYGAWSGDTEQAIEVLTRRILHFIYAE